MKQRVTFVILFLLLCLTTKAQEYPQNPTGGNYSDEEDEYIRPKSNHSTWGRDTTENRLEDVPIGVNQWTVDGRLGTIIPEESTDTVVHMFHYFNETNGYNGEYNILGNLGSPRLSRIYLHRKATNPFVFLRPYDYLIGGLRDFRFSNTLSPLTNLAFHKAGSKTNGQERLHAYFASNINKEAGIGMKFDYLYGRGYYNSQANSQFGGTLFGYYLGERYNIHAYANLNHLRMAENGGIEDDAYIRDPQSFPRKFTSKDIPTALSATWNRNKHQDYFLTHRYNLGFHRDIEIPDSLKPVMPSDNELLLQMSDSLRSVAEKDSLLRIAMVDSLQKAWSARQIIPKEFVPVSSIIHTLSINNLKHTYYSHNTPENYYTNLYYGDKTNVKDRTNGLVIKNTIALSLREGFNKWAQMGIALFAFHEFKTYTLPDFNDVGNIFARHYSEHNMAVGGELSRTQGSLIHYNANGFFVFAGEDAGDFEVDGTAELQFRLGRKDTVSVEAHGFVGAETPDFYYQHYHNQFTWWDNTNLSKEFKSCIEGSLSIQRTQTTLYAGFENIKNYTHYAMTNTLIGTDPSSTLSADYSHDVSVRQTSSNIQVFSLGIKQDLKFGPFHWDNEATYQTTSNKDALPLPKLSLYSNLYLTFRIAKVLNIEVGGDVRYFTSYYAPDYSTSIGQFAVQDANATRTKIGNYPIINAYVNLHIKHCRIYIMGKHLNAGTGRMFWAPHYPMDPMNIHFGVSWNFFN